MTTAYPPDTRKALSVNNFEVVDPDEVDGPINVVPECWDDEKSHQLAADWSDDQRCWCDPLIDGKYIRHRSVFDAIEMS